MLLQLLNTKILILFVDFLLLEEDGPGCHRDHVLVDDELSDALGELWEHAVVPHDEVDLGLYFVEVDGESV